jgi:hypothetical protein
VSSTYLPRFCTNDVVIGPVQVPQGGTTLERVRIREAGMFNYLFSAPISFSRPSLFAPCPHILSLLACSGLMTSCMPTSLSIARLLMHRLSYYLLHLTPSMPLGIPGTPLTTSLAHAHFSNFSLSFSAPCGCRPSLFSPLPPSFPFPCSRSRSYSFTFSTLSSPAHR